MAKKIITTGLVLLVIILSGALLMVINTPKYGIIYYDMGEATLTDSQGGLLSYPLTGVIGVPKNVRNAPVVFIFHSQGTVSNLKDDKYYSGYEYLVKSLADSGMVAVSVNVNAQYFGTEKKIQDYKRLEQVFEAHLDQITKSAEGKSSKLGVDLSGKADLTNISLIGHGQSAQAVYIMANDYSDRNMIKSIVMVDPQNPVSDKRRLPDLPTAIVLAEHDGNLGSLFGYTYFDRLSSYDNRKSPANVTLLKGANDNFFNSYIKTDDAKQITQNRLSEDDQRYFLGNYCVEFLKSLNKKSKLGVFNPSVKSDEKLFGFDVLSTALVPNRKYILNAAEDKKGKNSLGDIIFTTQLSLKKTIQSTDPKIDTSGMFSHPIAPGQTLYMYELSFDYAIKPTLDIAIPKKDCDFSQYNGINLYLAPNPYSELTTENIKFDVVLTDASNQKSTVSFDNMSALNYYPAPKTGGAYTPLSGAKVPLTQFKGIDLTNIKRVTINFKNVSADLMLNSLYLFNDSND